MNISLDLLRVCTIFNFSNDFYKQLIEDFDLKYSFFFSNDSILSVMLRATSEIEYIHFQILRRIRHAGKLELDNLILEFLKQIVTTLTNENLDLNLQSSMKSHHLRTTEQAKEYMNSHYYNDISLVELANHCCVSPFHFSRIFKKFTTYTPHQYLQNIRLKHSELLIQNSSLSMY